MKQYRVLTCEYSTRKINWTFVELIVLLIMKMTDYFKYTRKRADRKNIKFEWIKYVVNNPRQTIIQEDGRIKKWAKINEVNKYLRVILLEDGKTIHNAFFDRGYKEDSNNED